MKNRLAWLGLTLATSLSACTKNILDSAAVPVDPIQGPEPVFSLVTATCSEGGEVFVSAQEVAPQDDGRAQVALYRDSEFLGTWELRSQDHGLYLRALSADLVGADCRTETLYAAVTSSSGGGETVHVTAESDRRMKTAQ